MKQVTGLNRIRTSLWRCLLILMLIVSVYLLDNLSIAAFNREAIYIYIIKPLLWVMVIITVWSFPRVRIDGKLRLQGFLRWWAAYFAVFYIILMFLGGIIDGFGKSPYDLSPGGILKNIILIGSMLVGREMARGYMSNSMIGKHPALAIGIISLLMTILSLPANRIGALKTGLDIVGYLGEYFLPELSKNIAGTYLVCMGGPALSIIYLGIIQGTFWLSPVLPDLKWMTKALIGTLCPVFSLMFLQYMYSRQMRVPGYNRREKENPIGWIATGVLSIAIVWFAAGVFPVRPSVIATGSMKPSIKPGDVVIIKNVNIQDLKVGDIIQYKADNIYIFHRIIKKLEGDRQTKYITKGDNNPGPDLKPVDVEQIKGRVISVIPKIGWPTLIIKSRNRISSEGEDNFYQYSNN